MPTYTAKAPSGATVDATGDRPPTADEWRAIFQAHNINTGEVAPPIMTPSGPAGTGDTTDSPDVSGRLSQLVQALQGVAHPQTVGDLASLAIPSGIGSVLAGTTGGLRSSGAVGNAAGDIRAGIKAAGNVVVPGVLKRAASAATDAYGARNAAAEAATAAPMAISPEVAASIARVTDSAPTAAPALAAAAPGADPLDQLLSKLGGQQTAAAKPRLSAAEFAQAARDIGGTGNAGAGRFGFTGTASAPGTSPQDIIDQLKRLAPTSGGIRPIAAEEATVASGTGTPLQQAASLDRIAQFTKTNPWYRPGSTLSSQDARRVLLNALQKFSTP